MRTYSEYDPCNEYLRKEPTDPFNYCNCKESENPMKDPIYRLMMEVRKLVFLTGAAFFGKSIIAKIGAHFLAIDELPAKVHYVDWWPRTCQKVKEIGSKIWDRRTEGAAVTSVLQGAFALCWWNSDLYPSLKSFTDTAEAMTNRCLKFFDQTTEIPMLMTAFGLFPSIGAATSTALGSYDIISQYFDKDHALEVKPIFNKSLQTDLDEIADTIRTTKEEKGFFQNLLLYGPPGTGKTMISKWIAKHSGMNWITLSGGDLLKTEKGQTGPGAAVAMLQKLMNHAKSLPSPTVVFIDEAEACLKDRNKNNSQEMTSLLNAFLELTGQPSSKVMLVLATNLPNDLDKAVRSRMGYTLHVDVPGEEERKQIINQAAQIFVTPERQHHFSKEIVEHIAKQTDGCSGRDLATLISRLNVEARKSFCLTTKAIDLIVKKFMRQISQIEHSDSAPNPLNRNPLYKEEAAMFEPRLG